MRKGLAKYLLMSFGVRSVVSLIAPASTRKKKTNGEAREALVRGESGDGACRFAGGRIRQGFKLPVVHLEGALLPMRSVHNYDTVIFYDLVGRLLFNVDSILLFTSY